MELPTSSHTERHPLVVGELRSGRPGAPRILVYGHYDVQTVHPLDAWTSPPFEPEIRDGYIYARGASDDKGNMHSLLSPLFDLAREGDLGCDVTLVSDGEEEVGGDSVVRWLNAGDRRFDAAIVFDGSQIQPGWPALTIGVRGVAVARVTVRTATSDVHSGMYGGAALNAAHVLTRALAGCLAVDGRVPDDLAAGVVPPSAEEIASWATLPPGDFELATVGVKPADARAVEQFHLRTLAWPTFEIHALTCRDTAHQRTIVPCEAEAMVSMRLVPRQDPTTTMAALEARIAAALPPGAELTFSILGASGGCAFDAGLPALVIARAALTRAFGRDCAIVRTGGAIPLVSALHDHGVPTILSGIATTTDNIHAPNERLSVADYERGLAASRELFGALRDLPSRQAPEKG